MWQCVERPQCGGRNSQTNSSNGKPNRSGFALVRWRVARDEEILSELKGEKSFSENTYDACYVCILHYCSDPESQLYATLSLIVTFLLHVANIFLQMVALFVLIAYAIEQKQDLYEREDLGNAARALTDAAESNSTLNTDSSFVKLCLHDHTVPYTPYAFTWIWTIRLLPICTSAFEFLLLTCAVKTSNEDDPHMIKRPKKDQYAIVSVTLVAKFATTVLVSIPQFFVTVFMWWAGTKYLAYADSIGVLVAKCVALAFILQFPEFIFKAILHKTMKEDVTKTVCRYQEKRMLTTKLNDIAESTEDQIEMLNGDDGNSPRDGSRSSKVSGKRYSHWKVWGNPLCLVLMTTSLTGLVRLLLFSDLVMFRSACFYYKQEVVAKHCSNCGSQYFGQTFYS